jgi:hypothetical protein
MLQELIGQRVVKALIVIDYLQVFFEDGKCLSVYNKYAINTSDGRSAEERDLEDAILTAVHKDKVVIGLSFSEGLVLSIDMSFDGYLGPEAMQLSRPGLPTIVWRADD